MSPPPPKRPRTFNTAGPCEPSRNYVLPAAERLPEARGLIDGLGYFVVHAPRPIGKTTTLRALARALTAEGRYAALHFTCEAAEVTQDDFEAAQESVLATIRSSAETALPPEIQPPPWPESPAANLLGAGLKAWSLACPRPLVLFFDEIDALRGESLRSVLRQLRAGFIERPSSFPASIVLCGLRDVRDYKAASGGDPSRLGTSSPFNVKVESLRIGDFSEAEVRALYAQHTEETGQPFTDAALARAFELTQGQPWLVNALAREVVQKICVSASETIDAAHVDEAKERLILARQTHLDSLVARLMEPRVRRIVTPILEGTLIPSDTVYDDDIAYLRDLGLIARRNPVSLANPIYREVVIRVLAGGVESNIVADPRSFVSPDGRLDLLKLLEEFAAFWRQHGAVLENGMGYNEVAPQLVLMAFLQRVVNGGGTVEREVGIARGRIDVHVRWPHAAPDGKRAVQVFAIELKAWGPKKKDPLEEGLLQLEGYLDGLGLEEGTLVIFDRRPEAPPPEERTRFDPEARTPRGKRVTVLRG